MLVITLTKLDLVFLTFVSLIFVVGIAMMFLPGKKFYTTPSEGKFELNWTLRQILSRFSTQTRDTMADRWYEAREHLHKGVFVSLCCAFGLIRLIRIDLMHNTGDFGRYKVLVVPGWISYEKMMSNHEWYVQRARRELCLSLVTPMHEWDAKQSHKKKKSKIRSEEKDIHADGRNYYYYQTFVAGRNVVKDFMNS